MAEIDIEPSFNAPIAGQGMTAELGGRPWQSPPQYTTVEEAIQFYIPRMNDEEFTDSLVEALDLGVPISTIANGLQLSNVMDGKHSADVGILIMPVLMELMMLLADTTGVEYKSGLEEKPKKNKMIGKAIRQLKVEENKEPIVDLEMAQPMVTETTEEPQEDMMEEEPKGLMARRA
jgi:hypothetical protein